MRRFFFVLQGLLPLESIYWEHVPEAQLREGILYNYTCVYIHSYYMHAAIPNYIYM